MVDLDAENVDVAVRIGKPADSSLHTRHLLTNRSLLVTSPPIWPAMANPPIPPSWPTTTASFAAMGANASTGTSSRARSARRWRCRATSPRSGHALLCAALAGTGGCCCRVGWCSKASTRAPAAAAARVARLPYEDRRDEIRGVSWRPLPQTPDPRLHRLSGRAMAPLQSAALMTEPPGETLKTQTPGTGPGVWK